MKGSLIVCLGLFAFATVATVESLGSSASPGSQKGFARGAQSDAKDRSNLGLTLVQGRGTSRDFVAQLAQVTRLGWRIISSRIGVGTPESKDHGASSMQAASGKRRNEDAISGLSIRDEATSISRSRVEQAQSRQAIESMGIARSQLEGLAASSPTPSPAQSSRVETDFPTMRHIRGESVREQEPLSELSSPSPGIESAMRSVVSNTTSSELSSLFSASVSGMIMDANDMKGSANRESMSPVRSSAAVEPSSMGTMFTHQKENAKNVPVKEPSPLPLPEFEEERAKENISRDTVGKGTHSSWEGRIASEYTVVPETGMQSESSSSQKFIMNSERRLEEVKQHQAPLSSRGESVTRQKESSRIINVNEEWNDPAFVTPVGDLDGNGYTDYVLRSPLENYSRGAIRVYLMSGPSTAHFARHLVPGKWGFEAAPLNKGDKFGTSVVGVGDLNSDGVGDIAVGAPGDGKSGQFRGSVYIILLKADGSVLRNSRISAEDTEELRRVHAPNEKFGVLLHAVDDMNGDNVPDLLVSSGDGSVTPVFLSAAGEAKAGTKVPRELGSVMLKLAKGKNFATERVSIDDMIPGTTARMEAHAASLAETRSVRSQSGRESRGSCHFTDTTCQCKEFSNSLGSKDCLDVAEVYSDGRTVCVRVHCKPKYKCSCDTDATKTCSRKPKMTIAYQIDAVKGGDEVICHAVEVTSEEVLPIHR